MKIGDLFDNTSFLFRIFQESPSMVFVLKENMELYDTNIAVSNILGYGHSKLCNSPLTNILWKEDSKEALVRIKYAFEQRNQLMDEFYFITKDGGVKFIKCKGFIYDREDELYYILIGIDITEKKMLEQSEIIEYQKFQTLFNSSAIGLILMDLDYTILDSNNIISKMTGYERQDLLNKNISHLFMVGDNSVNIFKDKEIRYRKKDGFTIWALTNIVLHSVNNEPIYYIITLQDISEKKYFELKFIETEKKYRLLFDKSFNAIAYKKLIYDKNGNIQDYIILDANTAFEKMTGFKKDDIIGRPMKVKAQQHFKVSSTENQKRLKQYDDIIRSGKDVHFVSNKSRTSNKPIDVYYYILQENILAVVFGEINFDKISDDTQSIRLTK